MTVQSQISAFIPRNYEIFAGLDVDKHSLAVTFADHGRLLKSLRLPYSTEDLLNYVRKHDPDRRLAFAYEAGPTGFGLYDALVSNGHPCLVVLAAAFWITFGPSNRQLAAAHPQYQV